MRDRAAIALILLAGLTPAARAGDPPDAATLPAECTDKVDTMPDLCQTDEAFRALPYEGKYSCGPTAFANVLVAMDQQGYDNLVDGDVRSKDAQRALLELLGTKPYLETTRHGIGPISAMRGIEQFVEARGYRAQLEWQGWRRGDKFAISRLVDPSWLREGVTGESNVVVNVGWYRYDEDKDLYSRIGGHYMTLVGYRQDGDRFIYLIHDPAPRSGPDKVTHEAQLVPIASGRLAPWKSYGPREAAGHFRVEGIVIKSTADAALLDGAIRLTISARP